MGTTSTFIKSRSSKTPKVGEWNINYKDALAKAKKEGKIIVCCWSNGDACGYCVNLEKCFMDKEFTNWMKTADAYFVFQYSGDKDKGQTVHDLVYKNTGLKYYPGLRIMYYDAKGKKVLDKCIEGNTLRSNKTGTAGAKAVVTNFKKIFSLKPADVTPEPTPAPDTTPCKVRLNEAITTAQVNKILDAIEKNGGYCPCQAGKSEDTKCHCKDFKENKKIGEPCICKIFVKQKITLAAPKKKLAAKKKVKK